MGLAFTSQASLTLSSAPPAPGPATSAAALQVRNAPHRLADGCTDPGADGFGRKPVRSDCACKDYFDQQTPSAPGTSNSCCAGKCRHRIGVGFGC